MKLTDQEQVILKAIRSLLRTPTSPVLIADVVKAVGYPKATTKKVLARLAEKGIVAVHRHDYPTSLSPAERKLMLRLRDGHGNWGYYSAVSMRTRNPKKSKGKTALKRAGRALKGFARGALESGAEILGAGAMALNPTAKISRWKTLEKKEQLILQQLYRLVERDYHKAITQQQRHVLLQKKRHLESRLQDIYREREELFKHGQVNPTKRLKVRNKYIDLVIKGQAKKTPQGWRVGKKTFAQGRGTVNVSSGYYLDRHTGMVYAKRERNTVKRKRRNVEQGFYDASGFHPIRASSDYSEGQRPSRSKRAKSAKRKAMATASHKRKVSSRRATTRRLASRAIKKTVKSRRRRNISEGFYDASGTFHPIRSASDYDPGVAGETGRKAKTTRSRKRLASKRKASATARGRSLVKTRKAPALRNPKREAHGKQIIGTARRLAKKGHTAAQIAAKLKRSYTGLDDRTLRSLASGIITEARRNPSAESVRKKFAGSVNGERDLFFPQGTPVGKLAKLGKLVSITTEEGTIKPVSGTAWLCADTKGKLHIGSTTQVPLFDGPKRSFGKVSKFEYQDVKKHLGHNKQTIFFHHAGEENGIKPTLHADGKGGLVFKGGDYRITSRGVEN